MYEAITIRLSIMLIAYDIGMLWFIMPSMGSNRPFTKKSIEKVKLQAFLNVRRQKLRA
jgi:hypothetical protein